MADQSGPFWALIESSRRGPGLRAKLKARLKRDHSWARVSAQERTERALTGALGKLPPQEIAAFDLWMRGLLDRAYRADLWAAAYLVCGGCSDDGFEYFRLWLISRGRGGYESVLANPENLADVLKTEPAADGAYELEFESLAYCAPEAYERATDGDELPFREGMPPLEGEGSIDVEDSGASAKRWPRLGKAVGEE
jgi:hypothetical protein